MSWAVAGLGLGFGVMALVDAVRTRRTLARHRAWYRARNDELTRREILSVIRQPERHEG